MRNINHDLNVELILLSGKGESKDSKGISSEEAKKLQDEISNLKKQLAKKTKISLDNIAKEKKKNGKTTNDFQDIKDIINGKNDK